MKNFSINLFCLTLLLVNSGVLGAQSAEGSWRPVSQDNTFKLHIYHVEPDVGDLLVSDGLWKRPGKVDSNLVDKIIQLRISLPSWQGTHHLAPGTGRN